MTTQTITREIAAKVLTCVDAGLVSGVGKPIPGQMCVEAAVCYALGLPHGDDPKCVAPSLRSLKIRLNDSAWFSDQARARGLRRLALAQLGSAGVLDEKQFLERVVKMTISKIVPRALRAAAGMKGNAKHMKALETAAVQCEVVPTKTSAQDARAAAAAAAAGAANAADGAAYAAYADARNRELSIFAEEVVKILIDMKAPGCEWLDLTEAA